MQKDFELETILSVTTGINCSNDFSKVHELACFVFNDNFMNTMALEFCKDDLKEHLLDIHPQLRNVTPPIIHYGIFLDSWLRQQKEKFGKFLPVSEFEKTLVEEKQNLTVLAIPSDQAFVVAPEKSKKFKYVKPNIEIRNLNEETTEKISNSINKESIFKKTKSKKKIKSL